MMLFFLITIFSFLLQLFLPWWSMAIAAFVISFLLGKKPWQVFLAAFFACGIVWLLMALYTHFMKGDLMTNRIAGLLFLHGSLVLYIGVFLIAAIVGGFAALTGFYLKEIFKPKKLITGTW
ncbi:MAG TPA: hypothetical protein VE978_21305 [Chitinophagales bacterium]|nr:hypothetical protein [Chitinophagales bacterium]